MRVFTNELELARVSDWIGLIGHSLILICVETPNMKIKETFGEYEVYK